MPGFDVVVIGGGVMGLAAACELAREGSSVALIDQSELPNPQAASIDHSKVFRFAYPDQLYIRLAMDALERWRSLESDTGTRLLTETGALLIGKRKPSFETECFETMRSLGVAVELLEGSELERFPQFNTDAFSFGVYDPSGAILHAETAVRALIKAAKLLGVEIVESARVVSIGLSGRGLLTVTGSGLKLESERAIVASGPWSRKLLPFLENNLTTTRQEIVYFKPVSRSIGQSFDSSAFPIFLELESGFYGFPVHHAGAMKIANHHKGAQVDADSERDPVGEAFVQRCRSFFEEIMPALADAEVVETRVCIYNNTPDDDFIIDWHPQIEGVLVVTGFSGHGFKFGPTIGRIAADLVATGRTSYDIDRFRISRFNYGKGEINS